MTPTWWLVARRELAELWFGGRLLLLLLLFTLLMSVSAVLREVESSVNLIPPVEMIFLTLISTISFAMFIGLIAGADAVSGERERATLEPLLLTPTSRRQIVVGKFLAALSAWPVALLLAVPYVVVLAQGDDALLPGLAWTALLGTLLALAFTGFGMLVSIWSGSNRTSLFVSLVVYLLFVIPTQFPGQAQKGNLGYLVQQLNPMQASSEFIEKVIVNNRAPQERIAYLVSQPVLAIVVLGLLFLYAAPRLRLEGQTPWSRRPRRRAPRSAAVIGGLLLVAAAALPLSVLAAVDPAARGSRLAAGGAPQIQITTDLAYAVVDSGDNVDFGTKVTNVGAVASAQLIVSMNIINLGKGDPVDPEDWSPERTQKVGSLAPGQSEQQSWRVDAILEGDYMVFLTVVTMPESDKATTVPVASRGLHLTVRPTTRTNPGGVLPVALGMPILLAVVTFLVRRWWGRDRSAVGGEANGGQSAG